MAYRRRRYGRKSFLKRKRYVKRAKKAAKRSKINPSNYIGFPKNKVVKLRYVSSTNFNLTSLSAARIFIRANGLNDPEAGIGGHQPMGFDQWSLFYNHYVVLGSKITCKFASAGTAGVPCLTAIMVTDDQTVSADVLTEVERGNAKYTMIVPTVNSQMQKVTNFFSSKKFFNVKDVKDNVDRLGAPINADPTEEAFFEVACQTYDNQPNSSTAIQCIYTVEYLVLFSEPKALVSS